MGTGVFLLLAALPLPIYGIILISLTGLGIWAAGEAERQLGRKDAAPIVIDEISGILVTYFTLPVAIWPILLGFGLFRLFDICKPLPLSQLEQLPGGWGVMLDDLCAGLVAQCLVRLVLLIASVA